MTTFHSVPTPPQPRRRGLKIYAILVTLLFVGSLFLIFSLLMLIGVLGSAMGTMGGGGNVTTETLVSGRHEKIAILPISGVIDANMYEQVRNFCNHIKSDRSIKAVIVEVDSPGGTVTASDEIYYELLQLKQSHPLTVSMRSMAASGGYYVAAASDKIYAQPTTITGSIGIIMTTFQLTDLMQKLGIKPESIKSSNADDYKDAGSPFREMTDEDRTYFRNLLDSMHNKFAHIVDTSRTGKLSKPINEIAVGKIWTSDDAKSLGLIDDIAYPNEVWSHTATAAGLHNYTVIRLKTRISILDALSASTPKIELNLTPKQLESPTSHQLQFRH